MESDAWLVAKMKSMR